jgi:hypothetical protein
VSVHLAAECLDVERLHALLLYGNEVRRAELSGSPYCRVAVKRLE